MKKAYANKRRYEMAKTSEKDLGPLALLPGKWKGVGTGWNMIALPFDDAPDNRPPYRLLMNQYNEELNFSFVDDNVPNRGLAGIIDNSPEQDQFLATLDYQQSVTQIAAEDFPKSGLAGGAKLPIHHEPGLWLYMKNLQTTDKDITGDAKIEVARLASVPHGNSILALGTQNTSKEKLTIPSISGLPIGRFEDLSTADYDFMTDRYLEPYKNYIQNPFVGVLGQPGNPPIPPGFPGFNPRDMNEILNFANENVDIYQTTTLSVDSTRQDAGVLNIPFVVKQAEAVSMKSTFWIQELEEKDKNGNRKLRLQYSQVVVLDFFRPREDGLPSRAQWPHISINTLEKVTDSSEYAT